MHLLEKIKNNMAITHTDLKKQSLSTGNNGSFYYIKHANSSEEIVYFYSRFNENIESRFKKIKSSPTGGDTLVGYANKIDGAQIFKIPRTLDGFIDLVKNEYFTPSFENYDRLTEEIHKMRQAIISSHTDLKQNDRVLYKGVQYKIVGFNVEHRNVSVNLISEEADKPAKMNILLNDIEKYEQI